MHQVAAKDVAEGKLICKVQNIVNAAGVPHEIRVGGGGAVKAAQH